jgi:hypothetical protein
LKVPTVKEWLDYVREVLDLLPRLTDAIRHLLHPNDAEPHMAELKQTTQAITGEVSRLALLHPDDRVDDQALLALQRANLTATKAALAFHQAAAIETKAQTPAQPPPKPAAP